MISQEYAPAWRFTAPSATFQIRYPVGIEPDDGSAVAAAGLIWTHVPGVPVMVHRHAPPNASRQNSFRTRVPEVGGPMTIWSGVITGPPVEACRRLEAYAVQSATTPLWPVRPRQKSGSPSRRGLAQIG